MLLDSDILRGDVDLFHGLNQRLPQRRYRRQIATFHDLFVLTGEYSTPEFRARFAAQARHAAAAADHIIAVSEFTANQVVDLLGVGRETITVIHHGVRALPRPATARDVVSREKVVLNVGAIQARKNIVRLVHAFSVLPSDWRLVLAGSMGYGSAEALEAAKASPAAARIFFTGYLQEGELADWFSRASIFAFPSLDEGFGIPVLEAMAAGIPVLTSRTSATGEIADGAAALVDPLSTEEISETLLRLAEEETLRATLIEAGRLRAGTFTWENAVARTCELYHRVLEMKTG